MGTNFEMHPNQILQVANDKQESFEVLEGQPDQATEASLARLHGVSSVDVFQHQPLKVDAALANDGITRAELHRACFIRKPFA